LRTNDFQNSQFEQSLLLLYLVNLGKYFEIDIYNVHFFVKVVSSQKVFSIWSHFKRKYNEITFHQLFNPTLDQIENTCVIKYLFRISFFQNEHLTNSNVSNKLRNNRENIKSLQEAPRKL
jgi:hypothetical protein